MRWSILSEGKGFANGIIGLGIGIGLYCIFVLYGHLAFDESGYLFKVYGFMVGMSFIVCYMLASSIFTNMKTKLKRENFLMLPANNLEKYTVRLILTTIGAIIGIFCSLVIGDIIQFIFSFFIAHGFHTSITWAVIKEVALGLSSSTDNWLAAIAFYSFLLFAHSFATLGGTIYRKLPVLLTACTCILLCMILGMVISKLAETGILDCNISINFGRGSTRDYCLTAVFTTICLALAAFNYWASYKIFCRMQVICNKWINL